MAIKVHLEATTQASNFKGSSVLLASLNSLINVSSMLRRDAVECFKNHEALHILPATDAFL